MEFKELGLANLLLEAIELEGYKIPSPIQEQAIPHILEGRDVLGCAQTGTGKTAAFALPIINNLMKRDNHAKKIQVLILTPTRELAIQIRDNFRKYGVKTNLKCSVILGGVNQKSQQEVLKKGVDIVVATPGRLLDLLNQGYVKLDELKTLVLDEADTMLDMGFIVDVKKIINKIPGERQTLLFSATMPEEIKTLATTLLKNYVTVKVNSESLTVEKISQSVYYIDKFNKFKLLLDILKNNEIKSALIFLRTKHGANKLGEQLQNNNINVSVIHGNKSQTARVQALNNFKSGKVKIMLATDIAARGIDINELSHVINYEIPDKAETYVHRIGRTGRAGFNGTAISLCSIDEKQNFKNIEKVIGNIVPVVENHAYPMQQFLVTPKSNNKNNLNRSKKFNNKTTSKKGNRNEIKYGEKNEYNSSKFSTKTSDNFNRKSNNKFDAKNSNKFNRKTDRKNWAF